MCNLGLSKILYTKIAQPTRKASAAPRSTPPFSQGISAIEWWWGVSVCHSSADWNTRMFCVLFTSGCIRIFGCCFCYPSSLRLCKEENCCGHGGFKCQNNESEEEKRKRTWWLLFSFWMQQLKRRKSFFVILQVSIWFREVS